MSKKSSSTPKKAAKRAGSGCAVFAGVTIVVAIVGLAALVFGLVNFLGNTQSVTQLSGIDDDTSPEEVAARREAAEARLNSYGWVDRETGVVRIPLDRAMALIAENGLPVGIEEIEEPTPTEVVPTPTASLEVATDVPSEGTPITETAPTSEPLPTETPIPEPSPTPVPTVDLANVSFQENVLPIFERSCGMCHGGDDPEGGQRVEEGLILLNYEGVIAGSWNGSVIEPGDVEDSYLVEQVATGRMPKEGDRLTPAEVEIISAWVEAGALNN